MSERAARDFLRSLMHAGQGMRRHPEKHREVEDAVTELERAACLLTADRPEAVFTAGDEAFYLDTHLLAHASIEFHGMLRDLQHYGIDSITVLKGASRHDLAALAAVVAGQSAEPPAEGTVRLNERPLTPAQLESRPLSTLHRSYASSLDVLRAVSLGDRLELDRVAGAVDGLARQGAADGGAALMLATLQNLEEAPLYHSVNVCLLSLALGRSAGLAGDDLGRLGMGALLVDVGRLLLDDPTLRQRGLLSTQEWALVRLHPQEGALAILAAADIGQEIVAQVVLEHHVRFGGGGYPDLGGRKPHPFSRLVAVADAYAAITNHRPHRPARTPHDALAILLKGAGTSYDPDAVAAFTQMMGGYPPGSLLRLEGGEVVMVTAQAGGRRGAVVVRSREGALLEAPEPFELAGRRVAAQLLADDVGVVPAALLEAAEAGRGAVS